RRRAYAAEDNICRGRPVADDAARRDTLSPSEFQARCRTRIAASGIFIPWPFPAVHGRERPSLGVSRETLHTCPVLFVRSASVCGAGHLAASAGGGSCTVSITLLC